MTKRLDQTLGHWAARLSWASRGALERRLRPLKLTPPMMAALMGIESGEERAADLASLMGVDAAAVTRLLDRMADLELIERCELKGDKRARRLDLSTKAKALLPKIKKIADEVDKEMIKGMGEKEQDALIKVLKEMTQKAEKI